MYGNGDNAGYNDILKIAEARKENLNFEAILSTWA